ncbi:4-hydroxyacetophenone monooxygenase, partial [Mycobacterium sp. ITM-2017-0098]
VRTDAGTETLTAHAVITAVGQLNRPNLPDFPGRETFSGPSFHSAAWDHSVDLAGKRVALIGAGASGFQIAPAIADTVDHLDVFQR